MSRLAFSASAVTFLATNVVPLLYIGRPARMGENGALSDIAPSLLYIMNMEIPPEMTGTPLLEWLPVTEADDEQPAAALELHG